MGTVSVKKLEEALNQARGLGLVEESFTLGQCEIVLRNLRPDEYEAALAEVDEDNELHYLNEWQKAHICRSIQELNGFSLRDIDFIECEEPDPKKPNHTRVVKREKHAWLKDAVLSTWAKEAIYTAYRKFLDVCTTAESEAKKGVIFITPDETAEERFRRLLNDVKELEGEVAPALVASILRENGYANFTQDEDREVLNETLKPLEAPEEVAVAPAEAGVINENLLKNRIPLNHQVLADPPAESIPEPQHFQAPSIQTMPIQLGQAVISKRSSEFMAQEAEFDEEIKAVAEAPVVAVAPRAIVELSTPQKPKDIDAFAQIVDQPPSVGLNPKFRPVPR